MHRRIRLIAALLCLALLLTGCEAAPPAAESSAPDLSDQSEQKGTPAMEEIFGCPARSLEGLSDQELEALYFQALEEGATAGFIPVIVYADEILTEAVNSHTNTADSTEAYAASVLAHDHENGEQRLRALYQELEAVVGADALEINDAELNAFLAQDGAHGKDSFPGALPYYEKPYLLQVPVEHPWEIFAWVPFCGWNSCPGVDDMIAICRYWQERYGAIPFMISYDTLHFYLPKPVNNRKTAKDLAKEQVAFCDGVFEMGGPVLYAVSSLNSHYWSFWWD